MPKTIYFMITVGIMAGASAWGQSPAAAAPAAQLNLQVLAEALHAADTFHDLVKNLDVEKNMNLDGTPSGPGEPLNRMAVILGAGAGAGAAIGELKGGQKAIVIGAVAGAAGAFIVDQVIRHQSAKPVPDSVPVPQPKEFKTRSDK